MKEQLTQMIETRMKTMDALRPYVERYSKIEEEADSLRNVLLLVEDERPPALDLVDDASQAALLNPPSAAPVAASRQSADAAPCPRGCGHLKGKVKEGSRAAAVRSAMAKIGPIATTQAIARECNLTTKQVGDCLCQGIPRGWVERAGRAQWRLTASASPRGAEPAATFKRSSNPSQVLVEARRVIAGWKSGHEFTREDLVAEMSAAILSAARNGALADAMIRLRESGQIGLVSAPTPTSPAVYKTA